MWKISSFSWLGKVFISVSFTIALIINKKCASHFRRETINENKQPKETKTMSNSYLIRKGFQGYLCKSGIVIRTVKITLTVSLTRNFSTSIAEIHFSTINFYNQNYLIYFIYVDNICESELTIRKSPLAEGTCFIKTSCTWNVF